MNRLPLWALVASLLAAPAFAASEDEAGVPPAYYDMARTRRLCCFRVKMSPGSIADPDNPYRTLGHVAPHRPRSCAWFARHGIPWHQTPSGVFYV